MRCLAVSVGSTVLTAVRARRARARLRRTRRLRERGRGARAASARRTSRTDAGCGANAIAATTRARSRRSGRSRSPGLIAVDDRGRRGWTGISTGWPPAFRAIALPFANLAVVRRVVDRAVRAARPRHLPGPSRSASSPCRRSIPDHARPAPRPDCGAIPTGTTAVLDPPTDNRAPPLDRWTVARADPTGCRSGRGPATPLGASALLALCRHGRALPLGISARPAGRTRTTRPRCRPGTQSWKACFFGSFDSSNFISVDKSPASLWVMGLSARLFGVNAWSILVPQALEGVAAVGAALRDDSPMVRAGRRAHGRRGARAQPGRGADVPVQQPRRAARACSWSRGAYSMTRALESGRTTWLLLAFSFVGFGFLAKMLQALLVVPAFGVVYLFAGPPKLGRRVGQLALGAVAMLVSAGWWIAAVQLTPASARPYIGGSQNNSLWNLMFGYNGFGRLDRQRDRQRGRRNTQAAGSGARPGSLRMFNNAVRRSDLVVAARGVDPARRPGCCSRCARRAPTARRAAFLLWGGWLLVTGVAFSLGQGIIHPYYSVALAPAIGALVGMGAVVLWQRRANLAARLFMAATVLVTVWWSVQLLAALRTLVVRGSGRRRRRRHQRHDRARRVAGRVEPRVDGARGRCGRRRARGPGCVVDRRPLPSHTRVRSPLRPDSRRNVGFRWTALPLNVRGSRSCRPVVSPSCEPVQRSEQLGGRAFGTFGGGRQPFGPDRAECRWPR